MLSGQRSGLWGGCELFEVLRFMKTSRRRGHVHWSTTVVKI